MADSSAPPLADLSMTQLNALSNQVGSNNGNVYTAAINAIESHGKGDASTITNPSSGATGSMQTMGPTLSDPGFGVIPWNGTDADRARVGRDYYNALNQHFGDPNMAAIAYNWGPGNAQKWAAAGGDLNKLPMETLNYLNQFDQHVQAYGGGGQPAQVGPTNAQGVPSPQPGTGPQSAQNVPAPNVARKTNFTTMEDFNNSIGMTPQGQVSAPATPATTASIPSQVLAGAKESALNKLYGGQKLLGQASEFLDPGSGQDIIDSANQNLTQAHAEAEAAGGHTGWGKAGAIGADIVPYLLAPESIPAQAAIGAAMGGTEAAGTGQSVGQGALLGGVTGAAGPIIGKGIGAAGGAVKGMLGKGAGIIADPVDQAAAHIAGGIAADGGKVADTVAELRAGANSPVAGVERSAAEAAPNTPTIQAMTDAVSKTDAGQAAFDGSAQSANDAARVQHLSDAADTGLENDTQGFNAVQDALGKQIPNELPNLDPAFADSNVAGRPGFTQAIKDASTLADQQLGEAANPFTKSGEAAHANVASDLEQITGTPEQLQQMKTARAAQAQQDYAADTGYLPFNSPELRTLAKQPAFQDAWGAATDKLTNIRGAGTPQPFIKGVGPAGTWVPKQEVSIQFLQAVKQELEQQASNAWRGADRANAFGLTQVKNNLADYLKANSSLYSAADARYAAASAPISRMQALQDRLYSAVDPVTGQVRPGKISGAIDSIKGQWQKNYLTQSDHVSQSDIDALSDLAARAKTAGTNVANLSPEGQTRLLSALEQNAEKNKVGAADALNAFRNYLRSQSPSYAAHLDAATNVAPQLAARQATQDALSTATTKLSNIVENGGKLNPRNVQQALGTLVNETGAAGDAARGLLNDLRQGAGVTGKGATGSVPKYGGTLGQGISHSAQSVGIMSAIMHPHTIPHALAGMAAGKFLARGQAKVEEAMADLLSHGNANKLADALERVGSRQGVGSQAAAGWGSPGLLGRLAGAGISTEGAR